ncbi:hypothetical protein Tco_1024804 [Tanacetum coccineum]
MTLSSPPSYQFLEPTPSSSLLHHTLLHPKMHTHCPTADPQPNTHTPPITDGFHLIFDAEPQSPEDAPQSPEHAPPLPDYVPSLEYLDYFVPSDDEIPVKDQPLPADALPIALSAGYVVDFDPLEEDPKEDPADEGDDDDKEEDEESSEDDDEEEEDTSEEDEDEEEEHLASADSATLPAINPIP